MTRNPARLGKADSNHKPIADAIRLLGYAVMDLSAAGNGVEDLLVALPARDCRQLGGPMIVTLPRWWLLVECKVPRYKLTASTAVRYTKTQKEWREKTEGWPRITVTSAQDAVDQIRRMTE